MSDCDFAACGCFAGAREAFGLALAAARGLVADVVFGFAFGLAFDLATDFGFALAFGLVFVALVLAAAAFGLARDFAAFAFAATFLVLDFGASLGLREAAFRVRARFAVALPLFELFAMILASNSLSAASAFNPRGVLATALNTFQVFLPPPLPCGFTPC
jgi:hypothetical protein